MPVIPQIPKNYVPQPYSEFIYCGSVLLSQGLKELSACQG